MYRTPLFCHNYSTMREICSLSRRSFVKGVQATALVPLVGMTGCSLLKNDTFSVDDSSDLRHLNLYFILLKQWCDGMLTHQIIRSKAKSIISSIASPQTPNRTAILTMQHVHTISSLSHKRAIRLGYL